MSDYESPEGGENRSSTERAILAVLLSLAVYWMWATWFAPQPPPIDNPPASSEASVAGTATPSDPTASPEAGVPTGEAGTAPGEGPTAAAVPTPDQPETLADLQTDQWAGQWSTRGGTVRHLTLPGYREATVVTPVYTWLMDRVMGRTTEPWRPYVESENPISLLTDQGFLVAAGGMDQGFTDGDYEAVSVASTSATFERVTPLGLRIRKVTTSQEGSFEGRVTVRFENTSPNALVGRLWIGMSDAMVGEAGRYSNVYRPAAVVKGSLKGLPDIEDLLGGPAYHEGPVSWLGVADRYFLSALVPDDPSWGRLAFAARDNHYAGSYLVADQVTLAPGEAREVSFLVYAGPMDNARLGELGHDLQDAIQFGWFGFFARILLWLMQAIHSVTGNWGLAIIGLTFLVKAAFYPLTQKAFRSSKEMQVLQPILAEMKEKYKDNKEMQTQETMRLFKEHGVNPMGGCLPTLVQLPVWIALYNVLLFSVDLYHSSFLVYRDLSGPDPFAVLPVIVGVLMIVQQRMTPMTGMDPTQAKMMQLMPFIFVFFIFGFPSGLAIYICVNSVLSILQQWLINRLYKPQKKGARA